MPELTTELESEIKLQVPAVFTLPALIGDPTRSDGIDGASAPAGVPVTVTEGRALSLRAAYYDTDDLRLARSGATLRHRTGEGEGKWTLKLAARTGAEGDRNEFSVVGSPAVMPDELRALVTAYARSAPLAEVVELATYRHVWTLADAAGAEIAEFVDDLVSVVSDRKVLARFRELEIERRGIDEAALQAIVHRLEEAGAVRGAFQPKLVRALGPRALAPPDVPAVGVVRRADPAAALLAHALRSSVAKLLAQDAGVRLGNDDAVHQMRVACRRLRSDLRTFAALLEPLPSAVLREELAWLADGLGAARDLEVLRARLRKTFSADRLSPLDPAAFARLDAVLAERESVAQLRVRATLDDPRYVALLDLAVTFAREPQTTSAAAASTKQVLPPLVAAVVAELDVQVATLSKKAPDARWHKARILAKRARYAAEAAAAALGKPAAATGAALADVQDILGEHQDAAVAAEVLLELAARHPHDAPLVLLCGRLAERERGAVQVSRKAFEKAWKQASVRTTRRWLPEVELG